MRRPYFAAAATLALSAMAPMPGTAQPAAPRAVAEAPVAVVQSAVGYTARRTLVARSEKLDRLGWMEVETTFRPGIGMSYTVLREGGDGGIRKRVLRKVLENERQMSTPARAGRMAITGANYELVRHRPRAVRMAPLRKETTLVDGVAQVDAQGRLVRVEGRLAKSPSFWVRSVTITRKYQPIAGHAMPVHVESVADVKLAGSCEFAMWIDYTTVDGRPVTLAATRPHPSSPAGPSPLLVALQQQRLR